MAEDLRVDAEEFKKLFNAMRVLDPEIAKALRKRMTTAVKPIVKEVKEAEKAIPSKGELGSTRKSKEGAGLGLRASLAYATISEFKRIGHGAAMKIRVSGTKFRSVFKHADTANARSLPYRMEGRWAEVHPWKHPVFGNENNQVTQKEHPFMEPTIPKHIPELEKQISLAIEDAIDAVKAKRGV